MAGFGSFSNPQSSFGSFNSSGVDLSTPDGLLALAQSHGGAVAEAANELVHPQTSILSTIGKGFKTAFSGFVDLISIPSQIVAGTISGDYTIKEAIQQNIRPSDVIFGDVNPDNSTLQKVGGFFVRTATDILLDPLTYLTFGGGSGILGLQATSKITLGEKAAGRIADTLKGRSVSLVEGADNVARLSKAGQEVYKVLKGIERQSLGKTAVEVLKTGDMTLDLAGKELQAVLKATIDSPLNIDYTKKALTNLLEKFPQLTETLLDKGGIKVFGKSVLSGQRIHAALQMVPGMTALDEFTKPIRMALAAPFDPSIIKVEGQYVRLPQEYLDFEQSLRDLSNALGDQRITELTDVVRANGLSVNEAKYFMAAVEAGKMPADARLANAYKQLLGFNAEELAQMRQAGIPVSRLENHAPHVLVKSKATTLPFKLPPSMQAAAAKRREMVGTLFSTDPEKLKTLETAALGKDAKHFEEVMNGMRTAGFEGFDDNIVTALAARSLDNVKATTARYFMKAIAENFSFDKILAPEKFRSISSTGIKNAETMTNILGDVADRVYNPAIAKRIEEFVGATINDEPTMAALKAFDSLQSLWKASVTSIFPAFHGRNAISNTFQNFLDIGLHALNPQLHTMSGDLIVKDMQLNKLQRLALKPGEAGIKAQQELNDLLAKVVFSDSTGNAWTVGELRQVLKKNNIAFTSRITTSTDTAEGPIGLARATFPIGAQSGAAAKAKVLAKKALPISQEFKVFEYGRAVGNAVETHSHLINFLANLRNTGDVGLAAARTKQFLFDYNHLTNFERTFLRRLIPFYSYTRKNLELQVTSLLTTPGRTAAQFTAINTLGEMLSGGQQLTDQERNALPDWMKSGIGILLKKNGENVTMLSTLGTPIEQPFQAFQPNALLGSISPVIRLPFEQLSGYSLYQGKPLSDVTNAAAFKHAPEFVKQLIGYTELTGKRSDGTPYKWYVALNPEMMNVLLNLPPTSRVLSAMKQMDAVDVSTQAKIAQQTLGIRPYSFDLVREQQKRQNELKAKLEDLLTKAGVTAQFTRTFVPKAE